MSRTKKYLTVKEAADFLGVASNTIRNWDRDGKISVYRHPINRYRLFRETDLKRILSLLERSRSNQSRLPQTRGRTKPK